MAIILLVMIVFSFCYCVKGTVDGIKNKHH
jgi:hypothetical protein